MRRGLRKNETGKVWQTLPVSILHTDNTQLIQQDRQLEQRVAKYAQELFNK